MAEANQRFMKRLYGPKDLYKQMSAMMVHVKDMRPVDGEDRISKRFIERIMMAVTEVNGCRYCSYFHTQVALKEGIRKEEVDQLLSGCLEEAPGEEIAALYFAQHYAESGGEPEQQAVQCLQDTYGLPHARQIREYIRMIMIGNTWGNAFNALGVRLKGRPAGGSSLGKELGVVFGPFWMMPAIALQKLISRNITVRAVR